MGVWPAEVKPMQFWMCRTCIAWIHWFSASSIHWWQAVARKLFPYMGYYKNIFLIIPNKKIV